MGEATLATLPEDIRGEACLATVPDIPTLAKNYVNAQKMIGVDKIPKPNVKWGEKEWNEFHAAAGRPTKAEEYKVPELKLSEGVTIPDEALARVRKQCFDIGLNQKQFEATLNTYIGELNSSAEGIKTRTRAEMAKAMEDLTKKFGDKTKGKLDLARAAMSKFGDEGFQQRVAASGLGNDVVFVEMLSAMGELMVEDRIPSPGGGRPNLTPSDAAIREIANLKMDADFTKMLLNKEAQGHKEALSKWEDLHRMAFPEKK